MLLVNYTWKVWLKISHFHFFITWTSLWNFFMGLQEFITGQAHINQQISLKPLPHWNERFVSIFYVYSITTTWFISNSYVKLLLSKIKPPMGIVPLTSRFPWIQEKILRLTAWSHVKYRTLDCWSSRWLDQWTQDTGVEYSWDCKNWTGLWYAYGLAGDNKTHSLLSTLFVRASVFVPDPREYRCFEMIGPFKLCELKNLFLSATDLIEIQRFKHAQLN